MTSLAELFDLSTIPSVYHKLFEVAQPWDILARLDHFWDDIEPPILGEVHPTAVLEGKVFVADGASIGPHSYVKGPAWIDAGASVGHGVYLRNGVILMSGANVGHASEIKRSLLMPKAKAPHFNYIGDSIIGSNVNLGAGVKIANFHVFGKNIKADGQDTGLRKLGAIVGDDVSVGCNAVLAPGTFIGARTAVYHGSMVRGTVPADSIVKNKPDLDIIERQPI